LLNKGKEEMMNGKSNLLKGYFYHFLKLIQEGQVAAIVHLMQVLDRKRSR